MDTKVAVIFVHGMGIEQPNFAYDTKELVKKALKEDYVEHVEMESIFWADIFQHDQNVLNDIAEDENLSKFFGVRDFLVSYLTDTIYYQIFSDDRDWYDRVHMRFAQILAELSKSHRAGANAPLIVVAHSLGTVIASNYIYDLQHDYHFTRDKNFVAGCEYGRNLKQDITTGKVKVSIEKADSALARGETFMNFITLGSPLAIYNLRFRKPERFGLPIQVPSEPAKKAFAAAYNPKQKYWTNFYDKDDVIAYPLEPLNQCYRTIVHDERIAVGWTSGVTPLSHTFYWKDRDVINEIARAITALLEA